MARIHPSPVQQLVDRSRLVMQDFHVRVLKTLHFRVLKNLFPYQLLESWGRAVLVVALGHRRQRPSARLHLDVARRRPLEWAVTSRVYDVAAPRRPLADRFRYGLRPVRVNGCVDFG